MNSLTCAGITVGLRTLSSRTCGLNTATFSKATLAVGCQGDGASCAALVDARSSPTPERPRPRGAALGAGDGVVLAAVRLWRPLASGGGAPTLLLDGPEPRAGAAAAGPGSVAPAWPPLAALLLLPVGQEDVAAPSDADAALLALLASLASGPAAWWAPAAPTAAAVLGPAGANSRRGPRERALSTICSGIPLLPRVRTCTGSCMRPRRVVRKVSSTCCSAFGGMVALAGSAVNVATHWLAGSWVRCVQRLLELARNPSAVCGLDFPAGRRHCEHAHVAQTRNSFRVQASTTAAHLSQDLVLGWQPALIDKGER